MLNNNFSASEPDHECSLCHEVVSNPLCPSCLSTQIEAWMTLYPNYHELKDTLMPKLQTFIHKCHKKATECIKCKRARVSICPYCFTNLVVKELKELEVHPIILKEFLRFFNFNSEQHRYNKLKVNLE
tara:strand:+ start:180 stop:563 length:384 start_codon:yes stop_codon:yes gene_type:complete